MNMQVIISNNKLEFILYFLEKKDLLKYFSYIICDDYAYAVTTRERIKLEGAAKPSVEGYLEAARYFKLPPIKEYYGDHTEIDRSFAESLNCEFVMISGEN